MNTINFAENVYLKYESSQMSYSLDNLTNWTPVSWPITLVNTNTSVQGIVNITTNFPVQTVIDYFDIGSDKITIQPYGISIAIATNTASDYTGLVRNGTDSTGGKNNIILNSLRVENSGGSLAQNNGWIGQNHYGFNTIGCIINNCSSNGDIGLRCGGICGQYTNRNSVNKLTVNNCYSTGQLSSNFSGGIFGANCNNSTANNCYSTGALNSYGSGGIFGIFCNNSTANNCYSTGALNSIGSGGIFGIYCDNSIANNCYSTGAINGLSSGGIFGAQCDYSTANNCYSTGNLNGNLNGLYQGGIFGSSAKYSQANNCYSTGNLNGQYQGGIFGSVAEYSQANNCYSTGNLNGQYQGGIFGFDYNPNCKALNCYTTGALIGTGSGGVFSDSTNNNVTAGSSNNYSEGNNGTPGWKTTNAKIYLTGVPNYDTDGSIVNRVGLVWCDISSEIDSPNLAYLLYNFGYSPYTIELESTYISYYAPGFFINGPVNTTFTNYDILSINNSLKTDFPSITLSSEGIISTLESTPLNTYNIVIRSWIENDSDIPYTITTYQLNLVSNEIDFLNQVYLKYDINVIKYSNNNINDWTPVSWPISLVNTNTSVQGIVNITTNFPVQNVNDYFNIGSDNITIQPYGISIAIATNTALDYPGLVRNGYVDGISIISGKNNIILNSLRVENSVGSLAEYGGWIGQSVFSNQSSGCEINNCSSNGDLVKEGGGICGDSCVNLTANNCYYTGDINGENSGGIFGPFSESSTANNCYSTGQINGIYSGGIFGSYSKSNCIAENCYSIGEISGASSGGIFGAFTGQSGPK